MKRPGRETERRVSGGGPGSSLEMSGAQPRSTASDCAILSAIHVHRALCWKRVTRVSCWLCPGWLCDFGETTCFCFLPSEMGLISASPRLPGVQWAGAVGRQMVPMKAAPASVAGLTSGGPSGSWLACSPPPNPRTLGQPHCPVGCAGPSEGKAKGPWCKPHPC